MRRTRAQDELLLEVTRQVRRRQRRRLAAASGVLTIMLAAGLYWHVASSSTDEYVVVPMPQIANALPEQRTLPDNSIAELNAGAEIDVDFGHSGRRVTLRRGAAHFAVVRDGRPFVVVAAGVAVTAVGTAFSVQLGGDEVEVIVTEGRVQVDAEPSRPTSLLAQPAATPSFSKSRRTEEGSDAPILSAGYRAVIPVQSSPSGTRARSPLPVKIGEVSAAELADRLAWRIPNLEFSHTPLRDVVELMNRYAADRGRVQFRVGSAALREVKLSGFLRADNSEGLVRLLESNFGVTVERSSDMITLYRHR